MKIKSILVSGILLGSLAMVGCSETTEVQDITSTEEPAPVEYYSEDVTVCRDCGNDVNYCTCVGYDCINCGQWHTEEESYYNEDGMSACSEQCFNEYTGQTSEPEYDSYQAVLDEPSTMSFDCKELCEVRGMDCSVRSTLDMICDNCYTVVEHEYVFSETKQSGAIVHTYRCIRCVSLKQLIR